MHVQKKDTPSNLSQQANVSHWTMALWQWEGPSAGTYLSLAFLLCCGWPLAEGPCFDPNLVLQWQNDRQERMHFNSFVGGVGRKDLSPVCNLTWLMLVLVLQGLSLYVHMLQCCCAFFVLDLTPCPGWCSIYIGRKIDKHINLPFLFCIWGRGGKSSSQAASFLQGDASTIAISSHFKKCTNHWLVFIMRQDLQKLRPFTVNVFISTCDPLNNEPLKVLQVFLWYDWICHPKNSTAVVGSFDRPPDTTWPTFVLFDQEVTWRYGIYVLESGIQFPRKRYLHFRFSTCFCSELIHLCVSSKLGHQLSSHSTSLDGGQWLIKFAAMDMIPLPSYVGVIKKCTVYTHTLYIYLQMAFIFFTVHIYI